MSVQKHGGTGDNVNVHGNLNINNVARIPSTLSDVVNELAKQFHHADDDSSAHNFNEYSVNEKISYNSVIEYEELIHEFSAYQGKLIFLYNTFEDEGSNKKSIILRNLYTLYIRERGKLRKNNSLTYEQIRKQYSDEILKNIINQLTNDIINSSNINVSIEEARQCIYAVVVDGFIQCKILENPNKS